VDDEVRNGEGDTSWFLYPCKTPEWPFSVELMNMAVELCGVVGDGVGAMIIAVVEACPASEPECDWEGLGR